jgi:hypothetical protein
MLRTEDGVIAWMDDDLRVVGRPAERLPNRARECMDAYTHTHTGWNEEQPGGRRTRKTRKLCQPDGCGWAQVQIQVRMEVITDTRKRVHILSENLGSMPREQRLVCLRQVVRGLDLPSPLSSSSRSILRFLPSSMTRIPFNANVVGLAVSAISSPRSLPATL